MNFAEIAEFVGGLLFLLFVTFQIIRPLWRNTPLFPMFRKTRRNLTTELREVRGSVDDQRIAKELEATRRKIVPKPGAGNTGS